MFPTRETFKEIELTRSSGEKYKVVSIYTRKGTNVFPKRRLCEVVSGAGERVIVKAKNSGVITQVLIKVDDVIKDGSDIVELEACSHTALMGNICCDCGTLLEEKDIPKTPSVSMLHSVPDLKIARNEAQKLGQEDIRNLLRQRKLVLLVDLDQTLIHTTNDSIPPDLKDVYHFQLSYGGPWYHARLRPHTRQFLETISRYYELHISTFGVREYAHHIAHFLDPDRKLFGQRILSRNECLDLMSKKANLDSLFPCGDNLVCIIDDRTDVWNFAPNVVQVAPYHFFRHTGDINAPSGLQKTEEDDRTGIDFRRIKKEDLRFPNNNNTNKYEDDEERKNYSSDSEGDEKDALKADIKTRGCIETCARKVEADDSSSVLKENCISEVVETESIEMKDEKIGNVEVTKSTEEKEDRITNTCMSENNSTCTGKEIGVGNLPESESIKEENRVEEEEESECKTRGTTDQPKSSLHSTSEEEDGKVKNEEKSDNADTDMKFSSSVENNIVNNENDKCIKVDEVVDTNYSKSEPNNRKDKKPKDNGEVENSPEVHENSSSQYRRNENQTFDVVDNDDYLLYLEDILKKIHQMFFKDYDALQKKGVNGEGKDILKGGHAEIKEDKSLPDLKKIVPAIRKDVLSGVNIVFSGVVPTQMKLLDSKAYFIATSFGARVSEQMMARGRGGDAGQGGARRYTTHVVAANRHTEKVNIARKHKAIKIVTPNWLWKCAERWELVEEKLFPLSKDSEGDIQRLPPHHCYFPEPPHSTTTFSVDQLDDSNDEDAGEASAGPSSRTRTPSGTLLEDVNPLIYFSSVDRTSMTDEVEKILSDEDEDDLDEDEGEVSGNDCNSNDDDDDEEEEEEEEEVDDDDGPCRKKLRGEEEDDDDKMDNEEDELPSIIFRQGGDLPSDDSDIGGESDDEGDLSRMGADLESLLS